MPKKRGIPDGLSLLEGVQKPKPSTRAAAISRCSSLIKTNMSTSVTELHARTYRDHQYFDPASSEALESIARLGLPEDLVEFYRLSNGALLHRQPYKYRNFEHNGSGWTWSIASIEELEAITEKGFIAEDSPLWGAARQWYALVDVMDGNWLAINANIGGIGEIIDCFHETVGEPGENGVIARTFTELFEKLLAGPEPFWLDHDRVLGRY